MGSYFIPFSSTALLGLAYFAHRKGAGEKLGLRRSALCRKFLHTDHVMPKPCHDIPRPLQLLRPLHRIRKSVLRRRRSILPLSLRSIVHIIVHS